MVSESPTLTFKVDENFQRNVVVKKGKEKKILNPGKDYSFTMEKGESITANIELEVTGDGVDKTQWKFDYSPSTPANVTVTIGDN
jgi:hypothetical protein